jgi:hypothetical protein
MSLFSKEADNKIFEIFDDNDKNKDVNSIDSWTKLFKNLN